VRNAALVARSAAYLESTAIGLDAVGRAQSSAIRFCRNLTLESNRGE
jgi:hypothetical protein